MSCIPSAVPSGTSLPPRVATCLWMGGETGAPADGGSQGWLGDMTKRGSSSERRRLPRAPGAVAGLRVQEQLWDTPHPGSSASGTPVGAHPCPAAPLHRDQDRQRPRGAKGCLSCWSCCPAPQAAAFPAGPCTAAATCVPSAPGDAARAVRDTVRGGRGLRATGCGGAGSERCALCQGSTAATATSGRRSRDPPCRRALGDGSDGRAASGCPQSCSAGVPLALPGGWRLSPQHGRWPLADRKSVV